MAQSSFNWTPRCLCYFLLVYELQLTSSKWNRFRHHRCMFPWSGPAIYGQNFLSYKDLDLWRNCLSNNTARSFSHTHTYSVSSLKLGQSFCCHNSYWRCRYSKEQFKTPDWQKALKNANTERIRREYFMAKNYVDTNPPKPWLDLFTIKQVQ